MRVHATGRGHHAAPTAQPLESRQEHEEREKREAVERSSPSTKIVHEAIRLEGEEQLERSSRSLFWSGIAAGFTMGVSLMAEGILRSGLPDEPWRKLISALGYSMGFLLVTLGRQQLYTETTLTVTLPLFHRWRELGNVLRFWSIVFLANIAGTLLFGLAAGLPDIFPAELQRGAFLEIGVEAAKGGFGAVVLRGILAGYLIALMVWLLPASESARYFVIITVTWLIAIGQLSHVIAGSVEVGYAAIWGSVSWTEWGFGYVLPALIGNTIGGVVMVAMLNHAQVRDEVPAGD